MDIHSIVSQMTLEEKASLCSGSDFWHTQEIPRLGIPAVMVSDGPHGLRKQAVNGDNLGINDSIKAVCFPAACATAASFDTEALREIGEAIGDSCRHEGVGVLLGPAINIKRSPLCGRNFEYFSEDPYLAGQMAAAFIRGVQSRHVGTSAKHFAVNNQEHRRMSVDSVLDERTLREIYLPAFEAAVREGKAWTVMASYNHINGVYATESHELLTKILRDEWGFDGLVMSDWYAVSDRVKALAAGLDLEMPASGGVNDARIVESVRAGILDEKLVDQSVYRILEVSQRYLAHAEFKTYWDKEAQHSLARRVAAECMVLLKNEDGILPLIEGGNIAIIGKFAETPRIQGGGSSHVNSFKVTSLLDALRGVQNIIYAQGYTTLDEEPDEALIIEAVRAAEQAEVAVLVAGLPDSFECEGYDRSHLRLPRCQEELIYRVAAANPNLVLVLYNGSPVEMPWIDKVKALVEAYLGGQAVGEATRDVLFGAVNPSGRLPESFPKKLEDTPAYLTFGGEKDLAVYSEGVFVGYRYYEKKKMEVLFPFGFGLSYTDFVYSNLRLSAARIRDTDTLYVQADVSNRGSVAGKDVIQLYVADRESTAFRPVRELKGFRKVLLNPGETKEVSFRLDKRAFSCWNAELQDWYAETGDYGIQIGRNSRDIVLEAEVFVESTSKLPARFTMDSILMDVLADPHGRQVLDSLDDLMKQYIGLNAPEDENRNEAEDNAITAEMKQAMARYEPLRSAVTKSHGKLSFSRLERLIAALNQR